MDCFQKKKEKCALRWKNVNKMKTRPIGQDTIGGNIALLHLNEI